MIDLGMKLHRCVATGVYRCNDTFALEIGVAAHLNHLVGLVPGIRVEPMGVRDSLLDISFTLGKRPGRSTCTCHYC